MWLVHVGGAHPVIKKTIEVPDQTENLTFLKRGEGAKTPHAFI